MRDMARGSSLRLRDQGPLLWPLQDGPEPGRASSGRIVEAETAARHVARRHRACVYPNGRAPDIGNRGLTHANLSGETVSYGHLQRRSRPRVDQERGTGSGGSVDRGAGEVSGTHFSHGNQVLCRHTVYLPV
jgi:hypothetical protein